MSHARSFMFGAVFALCAAIGGPLLISALKPETAEAATPSAKAAAAQQAFKLQEKAFQSGTAKAEDVYVWSRRWMEAEKSSSPTAAKDHLSRMQALETAAKKNAAAGAASQADVAACAFYVAEAKELAGSP